MPSNGTRPVQTGDSLSLLDHDDDLAAAVADRDRERLGPRLRCRTFTVAPGPWRPPTGGPDLYGLYVIEGLFVHRLQVGTARAAEILGPTDVLRPWQDHPPEVPGPPQGRWSVAEPARLAVLDGSVTAAACTSPELTVALSGRLLRRARELTYLAALSHLVKVHERLLSTLWHLAERWGRVTARGVVLSLPLTHEVLAEVVGAQRPSLTTGISTLERHGLLSREGRSFVLHGDPPAAPGANGAPSSGG